MVGQDAPSLLVKWSQYLRANLAWWLVPIVLVLVAAAVVVSLLPPVAITPTYPDAVLEPEFRPE